MYHKLRNKQWIQIVLIRNYHATDIASMRTQPNKMKYHPECQ